MEDVTLRTLEDGLAVSVIATPNDYDFNGEYDEDVVNSIAGMVEVHGLWGWCQVEVIATRTIGGHNFQHSEYLGGCSYVDGQDFIASSGYYDDMIKTCRIEIGNSIEELRTTLALIPVAGGAYD